MDFTHRFIPGNRARRQRTLLLLHRTRGDENDMIPLGRDLDPTAALLSPRGKILENGMPRFLRRLAEGVFDEEDVIRRAHELADFIVAAAALYQFDPKLVTAVGYSNGANIAAAILLLRPACSPARFCFGRWSRSCRPQCPICRMRACSFPPANTIRLCRRKMPKRLAAMLRDAGANVTMRFEPAGHALAFGDIEAAKEWIAASD